jgi:hypothetical protein
VSNHLEAYHTRAATQFTLGSSSASAGAERLRVGPTAQRADVQVVASPYRVCPLGAHIDHQGGPVTALALQLGIVLAFVPHASPVVALTSADFPQHPVQLRCVVCRAPTL